jgi:hypothetical protein
MLELLARHQGLARMTFAPVRDVSLVVRHPDDAAHDRRRPKQRGAYLHERHWRNAPFVVRASRAAPIVRSNNLKMRVYSSVHESGRANP